MSNEMSAPGTYARFRLEISGGFLLLVSFTGFLCGFGALAAAAVAAAVHELGHLAVILLQGSLPRRLRLDISGASLLCAGRQPGRREELCRALAGPGAGLLLWAALRASPAPLLRTSASLSLMLSLVNLLPAKGLDGGRVLACLLAPLAPPHWDRLSRLLSFLSAGLSVLLGALRSPQLFLYGLWLLLRS